MGHAFLQTFGHTLVDSVKISLATGSEHLVAQNSTVHKVAVVEHTLVTSHVHAVELFACLTQTGGIGIFGNVGGGEEIEPLVERVATPAVKVVHLQDDVAGVEVADRLGLERLFLKGRQLQQVVLGEPPELSLSLIHAVLALPQVEVDDVDAEHALHVLVIFPAVNIFRNEFRGSEEHPLEVGEFCLALHLDE